MTWSIDSTELIYLILGPGVLLIAALLLRVDLRLKARFDSFESRLIDTELRLTEVEGRLAFLQARVSDDSRELTDRVEMLSRQHEQIMLRDAEAGPYFRAIRIAEKGASIESLIEQTGITRSEAELIHALHGPKEPGADSI